MPINSEILRGLYHPKFDSPLEVQSNAMQLRNATQQGQMNDIKLQEAQQGQKDQAAQRADAEKVYQILTESGGLDEASLKRISTEVPRAYQMYAEYYSKSQKSTQDLTNSRLAGVRSQQQIDLDNKEETRKVAGEARAVAGEARNVAEEQRKVESIDPQTGLTWQQRNQSMIDNQRIEDAKTAEDTSRTETNRHNQAMEKRPVGGAASAPNTPFEVWQTQNPGGKIEDWMKLSRVDPEAKPPTAAMSKTLGYYERVANAKESIDGLEPDILKMGIMDQGRMTYAPNWAQSSVGQRFNQARDDFINATLRRESGAAISDAEYARFDQIYFPRPGDDAATLKQKKRARDVQMGTFKTESGRAYTQKYGDDEPSETPHAGAGPKVGDTQSHEGATYRFDGKQWVKQK